MNVGVDIFYHLLLNDFELENQKKKPKQIEGTFVLNLKPRKGQIETPVLSGGLGVIPTGWHEKMYIFDQPISFLCLCHRSVSVGYLGCRLLNSVVQTHRLQL